MQPSPNDTVVKAGSGGVIVDAAGNSWSISSAAQVLRNGRLAAFTANVAEIAYVNGVMWHENTFGQWYSWNRINWIAGQNPVPSTTDTIISLLKELITMSTTQSAQLEALITALQAEDTTLASDMGQVAAAINTLQVAFANALASLQPGNQIQPSDIANLTQIQGVLQTLDTQMHAAASAAAVPANDPAPPPPPAA